MTVVLALGFGMLAGIAYATLAGGDSRAGRRYLSRRKPLQTRRKSPEAIPKAKEHATPPTPVIPMDTS